MATISTDEIELVQEPNLSSTIANAAEVTTATVPGHIDSVPSSRPPSPAPSVSEATTDEPVSKESIAHFFEALNVTSQKKIQASPTRFIFEVVQGDKKLTVAKFYSLRKVWYSVGAELISESDFSTLTQISESDEGFLKIYFPHRSAIRIPNCTVSMFVRFLWEDFPPIEETMAAKPLTSKPTSTDAAKLVIKEVKELTENPKKVLEDAKEVAEAIAKEVKEHPGELLKKAKKLPFQHRFQVALTSCLRKSPVEIKVPEVLKEEPETAVTTVSVDDAPAAPAETKA